MADGLGIFRETVRLAKKDATRLPAVPVVSNNLSPHLAARLVERLDRATADPGSPLGSYLAGLPADDALRLLHAVQATMFPEQLLGPVVLPDPAGRVRTAAPRSPVPRDVGGY